MALVATKTTTDRILATSVVLKFHYRATAARLLPEYRSTISTAVTQPCLVLYYLLKQSIVS